MNPAAFDLGADPRNDEAPELRQQSEAQGETTQRHVTTAAPRITSPRERRLIEALLEGEQSREALDRRIGASNSPDVVMRVKRKGIGIDCRHVEAHDRDGRRVALLAMGAGGRHE